MSRFVSRFALISAAAFAAVSFASVASAEIREPAAVHVDVSKVNFANASQVRSLYHRIEVAASEVCHSDVSDPMTVEADAACRQQAVRDAVGEIGQPMLSAIDDEANGRSSQLAMTESNR